MKFIKVIVTDEYTKEYPKDILRLRTVFADNGFSITQEQASQLWQMHSENWAAGWLVMDGYTDKQLFKALDGLFEGIS
ncbi:MAG: hypothetical protein DRQ40_04700 [Gammaproteobacteria bacterium]|nr:MAG: hypothetical protein DRQ40_04700 [Gammaproteobacteria bacterium]